MTELSPLVNEFLMDYLKRKPYLLKSNEDKKRVTTLEEFAHMLAEEELIIRANWDKTPEEIIDILIRDAIEQYNNVLEKHCIPGYTAAAKVGNISLAIFAGKTAYNGEAMSEDTLFDIASMTKFYTQVVVYNLIKEGRLTRKDKIRDLDDRFSELGNVTVSDILRFAVEYKTPGRIDDADTTEEALKRLYGTYVASDYAGRLVIGKHDYSDIGMMIIKEVIERITEKSFEDLICEYIVTPLELENTYLTVPEDKYHLVTATPNASIGHVTDMKANMLKGGYSGHSGIITNYKDIQAVMLAAKQGIILPKNKVKDTYTPSTLYRKDTQNDDGTIVPGKRMDYYGKMGNTTVANYDGVEKSWVDSVDTYDTVGIGGSSGVNAAASRDSSYMIGFNPGNVAPEYAKEVIERANAKLIAKGKNPYDVRQIITPSVRTIDGKKVKFYYFDPRVILPVTPKEDSVRKMAEVTAKLRFLDFVIQKAEKGYQVDYKKHVA